MNEKTEPFLKWPGWNHLRFAWLISLAGLVWFIVVYGCMDALTAHRVLRFRVNFNAELAIPFIPEAAIIYMSIYPLFLAAPFILRDRREFFALAMTLNYAILIAGICFLLFPAQVAFPLAKNFGAFPNLYHFADRLSLTYNLMPSLHVALSSLCIAAFAERSNTTGRILFWTWAAAIAISTMLIHKHHLLDVITAFALAWITFNLFYRHWIGNHYGTSTTKGQRDHSVLGTNKQQRIAPGA